MIEPFAFALDRLIGKLPRITAAMPVATMAKARRLVLPHVGHADGLAIDW